MADFESLNKIMIIGKESQIVHIILKKNEKINVNKSFITYASSENLDEISYKNVDSLIRPTINVANSEQPLKKVENEFIVRLKNKENNIEYIGLSKGGKIMKISPVLYTNLYVKLDNVLAFNESIQLLKDNEMDSKFNKLMKRPNIQYGLIEKRLGENESMIIMGNSLIAFESTITFSNIPKTNTNNKYVNNMNDIIVEGPGLIIFEVINRKTPVNYPKSMMIFIPILLFILEILGQFIMHFNFRQNAN